MNEALKCTQHHTGEIGIDILNGIREQFEEEVDDHVNYPVRRGESLCDREFRLFVPFAITLLENQLTFECPFKFHAQAIFIHDFVDRVNNLQGGFTKEQANELELVMRHVKKDESMNQMDGSLNLDFICH